MKRKRAMALVLTLALTTLLAMLCGALLTLNRSSLSLLANSTERERAYQACVSALDYVRGRLSSDLTFATGPLGPSTVRLNIPGKLQVTESGTGPSDNLIQGQESVNGYGFQAQILNNMANPASVPAPSFSRRQAVVPPRSCLVVITSTSGNATRRLEAVLQRSHFVTASLNSSQDLAVTLNGASGSCLTFSADNPAMNAVRSNGDVLLPSGSQMSFGTAANSGKVTASSDVNIGGTAVVDAQGVLANIAGGTWLSGDAATKTSTEIDSNSTISLNQATSIQPLSASQLKAPAGATHPLPGGLYAFTGPDTVSYFSNPAADPNVDTPTQVFSGVVYDGGNPSGAPGQEAVYLKDQRFIPVGKVEAGGTLRLDSTTGVQPQLALGYDSQGFLDPLAPAVSSIEVQGDLTVAGEVSGFGSVITRAPVAGQGVLTIQGRSQLSAAPDQGTALYAEGPIKLQPVDPQAMNSSDAFSPADFVALSKANPAWSSYSDLSNWDSLSTSQQLAAVGINDVSIGGPAVRDSLIPNYQTTVANEIPGWPSTTPGGQPMPPQAIAYVNQLLSGPSPSAFPFNGDTGVSIGRHIRLREFLKTVDAGTPDLSWLALNDNDKNIAAQSSLRNLYARFAADAAEHGASSLTSYLNSPTNPYASKDYRDIDLKGLVYTMAHFYAVGSRNFNIDGAVAAAQGSLTIANIEKGSFHFNSEYLQTLLSDQDVKLKSVVWVLD